MNMTAKLNVINPTFTDSLDAVYASYGRLAKDLANSLHQVTNFVISKLSPKNKYGFHSSKDKMEEKLQFNTRANGSFSISMLQDSTDYEYFDSETKLSKESIMQAFDSFLKDCTDKELKNLVECYRVFLLSLTAGTIYGKIICDETSLVLGIGKYDLGYTQVRCLIGINFTKQ